PLATQVTSMDSVLESYRQSQKDTESPQNPASDISSVSGEFADSSQPVMPEELNQESDIPPELRGRTETTAILFRNISDMSDEENELEAPQSTEESTAAYVERVTQTVVQPLTQFFEADLRRNRIVIVLDDVNKFDDASLNLLGQVFMRLPELPLTIFMTAGNRSEVPAGFARCPVEFTELQSLSDNDLALLTHSILKKLSETREKLIVPKELCNLIAQRSFGSPKRTIELTLKHLNPDSMIHWNDAIERLKHEPIPHELGLNMVRRFKETPELERMVLQIASHLSAPFSVSTIESLLSTWPDLKLPEDFSCSKLLKKLRERGFLEYADVPFSANTPSYIFKHESERMMIFSTVKRPMRHHVYLMAAQWYSLNNPNGIHDEVIGDFWRNYQYLHESCRYYKRAARRAVSASHLPEAWRLFRKLLKTLPDGNIAERTKLSLEGAAVAFRMGQVDDAFRLCRTSCHHALKISAYNQAARSCIQMASMLIEMGSIRHMHRYTARANELLNRDGDAVAVCRLYKVLARRALFMSQYEEARQYIEKARHALSAVLPHPLDALEIEWTEAEIEADTGTPNKAIQMLNHVIEEATLYGEVRLKAQAYRSLGHIYDLTDNLSGALESWNIALGMVQEMNDVILHANLLADIADGALALEARKTARAATEQCLGLAQQTHQKMLIARCLANTAALQYSNDQYDKAMRTLRKAHKSATTLKSARLWIRTLSLFARLISSDTCAQCNYEKAEKIYLRLLTICSNKHMTLEKARSLNKYAQFLVTTHQTPKALEALNKARDIYQKSDLERVVKLIQGRIEELMQTDET
ncbi:MAG: tetratricopeptide repeat protein, partial [Proteobacteria bacterium]|nr:tetratricopeptide repeat protein [Pseudomonadota bacterium]